MEIKVRGLKEIEAQLVALGSKQGTKIVRASMLRASQPILDRARSNVASISNGSGALHKSLGVRFYAGPKAGTGEIGLPAMGGRFSVKIGPFSRERVAVALHNLFYKRRRKGIFYGHLIEFGHKIKHGTGETVSHKGTRGKAIARTYHRKLAREIGSAPARPFLLPALQSGSSVAVSILARELQERIARQLKKNAKK